jgi:MFS family permease
VITYVFAMMMLSLCNEYWQVMLVQGILMGIVMGRLQFPAFAAVSQYFEKERAAALGVVVSRSSIGGVVIPIALSKMLNSSSLGFGWSLRVIGFLIIITPHGFCVRDHQGSPTVKNNHLLDPSGLQRCEIHTPSSRVVLHI